MIVSLSILSAPLLELSSTIERMIDCGIDRLHLDIMDGHYVRRMAFGLDWVHAIRKRFPTLPIDVHFMTNPMSAQNYQDCLEAGADRIWLHGETLLDPSIRALHGDWVLSLDHSIEMLPYPLHHCLVMSVTPGAGGQSFCPDALLHIQALRHQEVVPWIAVDGGVGAEQIVTLKKAGVQEVIMGHALINAPDPKALIASVHAPLS